MLESISNDLIDSMDQIIKKKEVIQMNFLETIILTEPDKQLIENGGIVVRYLTITPQETIILRISKTQVQIERRTF